MAQSGHFSLNRLATAAILALVALTALRREEGLPARETMPGGRVRGGPVDVHRAGEARSRGAAPAVLPRRDFPAAARLAQDLSAPEEREEALRPVALGWAEIDPERALAWAAALEDAELRDRLLTEICLQEAERDPAGALRMRARFLPAEVAHPALENLAARWAGEDFPAALDWALARPPGGQRDEILARLAFIRSTISPEEAARMVVESIPPGEAQDEAVMAVLHQWAGRDLRAAADWVGQFPDMPLRERALRELSGFSGR